MSLLENRDRQITLMDAQIVVEAQAVAVESLIRNQIVMLREMKERREQLRAISARLNRIAA